MMQNKKIKSQRSGDVLNVRNLPPQVVELLHLVQQKVLSSPGLNGGFTIMMSKVEQIEEGQKQMGAKVDSIYEAIYHPDEGLFARIKDVEHVKEKVAITELLVERLEKDISRLLQQHESKEKILAREEKQMEENARLVKDHAELIKDLVKFKSRVCAIIKWGLVTLTGAMVTLVGKLIYDFISGHITVH